MSIRKTLRIANGMFWLWMLFSAALIPVINATEDNFWAAEIAQLFTLNPNIQGDIYQFIGNAVLPLILWFVIDRRLKPKVKARQAEDETKL